MANRQSVRPEEGEHVHNGSARPGIRGALYIKSGTKTGAAGNPAVLLMDSVDTDGAILTFALWIDSSGDVRTGAVGSSSIATLIADEDGSGTIVGTQS